MKVLLINRNDLLPFKAQYRLFNTWKDAIAAAREVGWLDAFGMGLNRQVGIANIEKHCPVDLTLIAIEEE